MFIMPEKKLSLVIGIIYVRDQIIINHNLRNLDLSWRTFNNNLLPIQIKYKSIQTTTNYLLSFQFH